MDLRLLRERESNLEKESHKYSDLEDFIKCCNPKTASIAKKYGARSLEGRFRKFGYDDYIKDQN